MTTQIGALAVLASMTLFLLGLAFTVGIDPYIRRITGASAISWRTTRNVRLANTGRPAAAAAGPSRCGTIPRTISQKT